MKFRNIIIFIGFFIAGCDSNESPTPLRIDDGHWELQSYGYITDEKKVPNNDTEYSIEIRVDNGLLNGNAYGTIDCNEYSADAVYSTDNNHIAINNFFIVSDAVCELAGDENYEQQNSFIIDALNGAIEYEISDLTLTITAIDSAQLIFIQIPN